MSEETTNDPAADNDPVASEATPDAPKVDMPAEAAPIAEAPAAAPEPAIAASETVAPVTITERTVVTKPAAGGWFWGTGRRKAAVARVRVKAGSGSFIINKRTLEEFFSQERDHNDINHVLKTTGTAGAVDVAVNIHGGGYTGQAGAIVLGLARALRNYDPSLDSTLRDHDFLTRDPRKVERKKPGQPGARKRFQFSKR
jgi:small subunit ribosomal protein S9